MVKRSPRPPPKLLLECQLNGKYLGFSSYGSLLNVQKLFSDGQRLLALVGQVDILCASDSYGEHKSMDAILKESFGSSVLTGNGYFYFDMFFRLY